MFRVLITLLFTFIALQSHAVAQNGEGNQAESVSISVSASVVGTTEVFTIQSVDFENIERDNNIIMINPVNSTRAGKMVVRGAANATFRMEYLRERELNNTEGPGIIIFNYLVSGNSVDEQETSELFDQDDLDLRFNQDGEYFIWVGGSVDLSEIEPGSYQGEFNLEIEYN